MAATIVSLAAERRDRAPDIPSAEPMASPEMALTVALLSALSVGNPRDRSLFRLVGWELSRLRGRAPDDPNLAAAADIYASVGVENHGR